MNRIETIKDIKDRIRVEEGLIDWLKNQTKEEITNGREKEADVFFDILRDIVKNYDQRADRVKTLKNYVTWLEEIED